MNEAIHRKAEEIQQKMCCLEHPLFSGVLCMRDIGHPGQHYFMVRWLDSATAIQHATEVLKALE